MLAEKTKLRIALAGNPNSGKSTLFNALTGLHQKTGNFAGVTVDKKTGYARLRNPQSGKETDCEFIDLPGTYSLHPKSLDERVAFEVLTNPAGENYPDITIIVADASNLKRNLLLATQIIDLKRPCLLALNMVDIAEDLGYTIQKKQLEADLGIPVVAVNSREKKGIDELRDAIFSARSSELQKKLQHDAIDEITAAFSSSSAFGSLLRAGASLHDGPKAAEKFPGVKKTGGTEFFLHFEKQDNLSRFKLINDIWIKSVERKNELEKTTITERLDKILTHRIFGILIFLSILFVLFQSVFYLAEFPMNWIEEGFSWLQQWTKTKLPEGTFNDLITDGVIAGLSGVVVFIPQIALLFAFLSLLEDSGYMARVSFIMDKMMRGFGLNGRSVIPLISGVACAVPAIMGARTISNVKERLITIMVTPLMSCSARLPVYTLLISLMVPESKNEGLLNEQGLWMMGLYLLGFVSAVLVALIFKFLLRAKEKSYFIMELPIYRVPQLKTVWLAVFGKVKVFLWDAGRVIMVISVVLWFLSTHGPGDKMQKIAEEYNSAVLNSGGIKPDEAKMRAQLLEASYAGHLGKFIEPAIRPLGFDWKIGISIITSFAAREVFVGTMATIYSSSSEEFSSVKARLEQARDPDTGEKSYSRAVCLSLLIFYVFAMQCMSTLAVVKRETKSWKWPIIQFLYMGAMAWLGSFAAYQLFS